MCASRTPSTPPLTALPCQTRTRRGLNTNDLRWRHMQLVVDLGVEVVVEDVLQLLVLVAQRLHLIHHGGALFQRLVVLPQRPLQGRPHAHSLLRDHVRHALPKLALLPPRPRPITVHARHAAAGSRPPCAAKTRAPPSETAPDHCPRSPRFCGITSAMRCQNSRSSLRDRARSLSTL